MGGEYVIIPKISLLDGAVMQVSSVTKQHVIVTVVHMIQIVIWDCLSWGAPLVLVHPVIMVIAPILPRFQILGRALLGISDLVMGVIAFVVLMTLIVMIPIRLSEIALVVLRSAMQKGNAQVTVLKLAMRTIYFCKNWSSVW